jgi:asparagine synthase (glutamine-hydrolysing)
LHDRPVRTYAINFGDEYPNELAYSGLVAAHCRTAHTVLTFDGKTVADHLAETVALLDCPVGDPLTTPNLLLARAAARDGLTVILNGEGGDPVFGGPKNLPMLMFEFHRDDPDPAARARAYLRSYQKCYDELARLLTPDVLEALRDAPPLERHVQPYLESPRMTSFLNRLLYTNLRTKGAHHILPKVERLTAASGIEGRSPLFDPHLIDAAFATPPALKLHGLHEKWILKLAVRDLLPSTILTRPKSGMLMPVQYWLHGPLREMANDLLLGSQARARGLFREQTVRVWMQGRGLIWRRHGQFIWLLLTLELWLRAYRL